MCPMNGAVKLADLGSSSCERLDAPPSRFRYSGRAAWVVASPYELPIRTATVVLRGVSVGSSDLFAEQSVTSPRL